MAFIPYEGDVIPIEEDMLMPVSGTMGGGYGDSRSGGLRKHKGGDLFAPAGTPLVAPGNMEFIQGKRGGTNLRANDWWSHWRDLDTGREYRFAHHGSVSDYTPGQVIPKGEQWGEVGNVVDSPHLHMAVYDPVHGQNIDWMAPLGLKRGTSLSAGLSFAEAAGKQLEQRASKVAAKTPINQMVPYEGEIIPFEQPPAAAMTPYTGEVVPEARQQPTTPGGWLDAAQKGLSGALDIVDIPSKYLLRKPLQYLHGQLMEPYRQKSEEEFGQYIQEPGAGTAAPEAFAPFPKQDVFVTPTEIALQGPLYGGLASMATNLPVKTAKFLYESAMKMPPKKIPNWLRKKIVETGLEEKIGVSQAGLEKTEDLIGSLNSQVSTIIKDVAAGGKTVDGTEVAKRLSGLKEYYSDAPNYMKEPIMDTLNNIQTQMILEGQIPIDKAQRMKQIIYDIHKKSYGERKSYEVEANKAVARGLKETIAEQAPEISGLNARESRLLDLQEVLGPAVNRVRNYNVFRMGDAIGAILGGSMAGPSGAKAGYLLSHLIDTPAMKARLGIFLNSLGTNPFTSTTGFRYAAPLATLKPYLEEENK